MMMKEIVVLSLVLHLILGGLVKDDGLAREDPEPQPDLGGSDVGEIDTDDELSFDDFEKQFGEDAITDPKEKAKRQKALKDAEKEVKKENKEFMEGKKEWFERIDKYSDLPKDEFEAERTGSKIKPGYARGLIDPEVKPVDEASERYFDQFRYSRSSVPASYSSVAKGYVTQVKNQKQCGSCVAFSNMAAIEVCFKKLTGSAGDYSEQQLVDCGYNKNGARGCNGAWTYSYLKTVADTSLGLTHESTYPYLNKNPKLTCPTVKAYNQGAKVTGSYFTYNGTEDLMMKLVAKHGAVVTSVAAAGPLSKYAGGVFAGCTSTKRDHAVTVVGYGATSGGEKYWLIKNSWGADWGEKGYIRLKRGVGMCGVGKDLATVSCGKVSGTTSAPLTTAKPCVDKYSNCPTLAKTSCNRVGEHCAKSCGLCKGMTPHVSNKCWNDWNNCAELAKNYCWKYGKNCCLSCGLGKGMTPVASNKCYDKYSNCASLCQTTAKNDCKKSCGKC